ncbi:YSIRK-type signal peptide-containing protein, partial [Staphylococcus borealis]
MKKKEEFLSKKKSRYSIRKFTVGTASILVGATLIYGSGQAQAAESEGTVTEQPTTESTNKESEGTVTEQPTTESTNKESEGTVTEQPTTESTNKES